MKDSIGFALFVAQQGGKHRDVKPLRGFGGAGILEVVVDHGIGSYRAVYTAWLARRVYVLHAFLKKSKMGIKMPKAEMDLIQSRLKRAQEKLAAWLDQLGRTKQRG